MMQNESTRDSAGARIPRGARRERSERGTAVPGEVATALAAFDDAFGRTLDALRASDVSEGSAWPTQKRASSLVLDLRARRACARRRREAGRRGRARAVPGPAGARADVVLAHVLALGPRGRGDRSRDGTRTRRTTRKAKSRSVGSTAWRFTFARARKTRCDVCDARASRRRGGPIDFQSERVASGRERREGCRGAGHGDARVVVLARPERHRRRPRRRSRGDGAGYGADVVHALSSPRALESHALLATPRHLSWRLSLVAAAVACLDDCAAADGERRAHRRRRGGDRRSRDHFREGIVDANVRAAGDAFLRSAKDAISDLKSLEAMDATPMDDARRRAYEEADARLAAMEAARPRRRRSFAETLLSADPETDDREDPPARKQICFRAGFRARRSPPPQARRSRRSPRPPKRGVARRTDAAFAFHAHARPAATHEARTAEAEARGTGNTETQNTGRGGDTSGEEHDRAWKRSRILSRRRILPWTPRTRNGGSPGNACAAGGFAPGRRRRARADGSRAARLDARAAFNAHALVRRRRQQGSGRWSGTRTARRRRAGPRHLGARHRRDRRLPAEDAGRRRRCGASSTRSSPRTAPRGRRFPRRASGSRRSSRNRAGTGLTRTFPERNARTSPPSRASAPRSRRRTPTSRRYAREATLAAGAFAWRFAREKLEAFQLAYHASSMIIRTSISARIDR